VWNGNVNYQTVEEGVNMLEELGACGNVSRTSPDRWHGDLERDKVKGMPTRATLSSHVRIAEKKRSRRTVIWNEYDL
jgi:hypothetical protein